MISYSQLETSAPAAAMHAPEACLNCGTPLHDRFCAHCGQAADTHARLTLGHWLHEIPHSVWHVDKGLPYTIREMLVRPASALRRYLQGQRASFFRPLTYLLLVTGLITFLYVVLHIRPYQLNDARLSPQLQAMREHSLQFFTKYINWFAVAMLPMTALGIRQFLRRAGFNYAECLTVACFVTATYHLFTLAVIPALYVFNGTAVGQLVLLGASCFTFYYQLRVYAGLLKNTGLSTTRRYMQAWFTVSFSMFCTLFFASCIMIAVNWPQIQAMLKK